MSTKQRSRVRRAGTLPALPHLSIECVSPALDDGRYPVKRLEGETLAIAADIYKDGHDLLRARACVRGPGERDWRYVPLTFDFNADRWLGEIALDRIGEWIFTVEGWTDRFGTWRSELGKKLKAGQDVSSELLEGAELVARAARSLRFGKERSALDAAAAALRDTDRSMDDRARAALAPALLEAVEAAYVPDDLTRYDRELRVTVDRRAAGFASWYEFFPRSTAPEPGRHGTFRDAERHLVRIAALGFDVVYLPPIHPIGRRFRKGKNNALEATAEDVGSPWAIGNELGGHTAVDPALGTIADFERFVRRAGELGIEVALDYALQCSPDHPWLTEHPDWFFIRPDGTIKYAENPPKKYQDIYPINFWCDDREALWTACLDIFLFWIARGVRTFRVDNPHTKPFAFWQWVIAEVKVRHPDVVFLSEAFTRPKKLKGLAKLGFSQSYTYFTWKTTSYELREWIAEMFNPDALEYCRGNLFVNTPDILTEFLQTGGRGAFRVRLLLAAMMSPLYGVYSGFELLEHQPVKPGSEEYLDSEKYELRWRDFEAPGNLNADMQRLNAIRREHPALQRLDNLRFVPSENEHILAWTRATPARDDVLLIVANLDPRTPQQTMITVPLTALGIPADAPYEVEDLLTGARYVWRGARNYVRLDPNEQPGHVFRIGSAG